MTRSRNTDLSHLVRAGGSLTRVVADFPIDGVEALVPGPRLRAIRRSLEGAGSPDSDVAVMTATLEQHSADREPTPRFLVIHDGELVVDELLPDMHLPSDEASFDSLPALIPLLMQRQSEIPYIVLEASAAGGRIRTFLAGGPHAGADERIVGEAEHLHKAQSGGLSHRRHAHHTEEVWKRNETELADVVNRLVERHDIGLLVITGDPHVIDLVSNALSSRARAILATLASDTLAEGATPDHLEAFLLEQLHRVASTRQADLISRAAAQEGGVLSATESPLQRVVDALQQAAVDTLLLDLEALESESLVALAGEPWVAAVAADTFGAPSLGTVSAAEALTRAAVATDADVEIVDHDALAGGASAAVVRR